MTGQKTTTGPTSIEVYILIALVAGQLVAHEADTNDAYTTLNRMGRHYSMQDDNGISSRNSCTETKLKMAQVQWRSPCLFVHPQPQRYA